MKTAVAIFYGLCGAFIGYVIGAVVATAYEMVLEGTDKMVTAKDMVDVGIIPAIFAGIGFFIAYKIMKE